MRIHTQSAVELKYNERNDSFTPGERRRHFAIEVSCPRCKQNTGFACKHGDSLMPLLAVHIERAEAAL